MITYLARHKFIKDNQVHPVTEVLFTTGSVGGPLGIGFGNTMESERNCGMCECMSV
jgi:hypothetical protein